MYCLLRVWFVWINRCAVAYKNDRSSELSDRKQGGISALEQRMARCREGCCYSLGIRWCGLTKSWTTKSPLVITINKRQQAARTKLLTCTPRRKPSPLLMSQPSPWWAGYEQSLVSAHFYSKFRSWQDLWHQHSPVHYAYKFHRSG